MGTELAPLIPLGDHVLVVDKPQETSLGGIELPGNVRQQEMLFGMVIAVGLGVSPQLKLGDVAIYGPYAGKTIVLGGQEFRILREGAVEGKLPPLVKSQTDSDPGR